MVKSKNPANGELLPEVPDTNLEDFPKIMESARAAQAIWATKSFSERKKIIMQIKRNLQNNAEELADIIAKANGKTRVDALATEILPCCMACDWYADNAEKYLKAKKIPVGNPLFLNKVTYRVYQPVGVVGIISPWNYPFSIPFGEVIMGLMAGNAIILKVATCTSIVGEHLAQLILQSDIPKGLFTHIIGGGAEVSRSMIEQNIDKIFFTGSVSVGKDLMKSAAEKLIPLSLELGGKDPMIVCEDGNIERATNCAAWGGYQNAGQSCGGVERIYVHRSVYPKFVQLLADKTKALRHGVDQPIYYNNNKNNNNKNGLYEINGKLLKEEEIRVDIGSMTTANQLNVVKRQVEDALSRGAKIIAQSSPVGDLDQGYFYPATLMIDVDHSMIIMKEETFGPIIPVMPFDTIEEAIALANDCDLALTSSVFSEDMEKAKKIAEKLHSGVTTINDHLYTHGLSETPWGGWKLSGLGRTHGPFGLREMSNLKAVNYDLLPSYFIPRNLWWYPFSVRTYNALLDGIQIVSPTSFWKRLKSVFSFVPFAGKVMITRWVVPGHGPVYDPSFLFLRYRKSIRNIFLVTGCALAIFFYFRLFSPRVAAYHPPISSGASLSFN